MRTMYSLVVDGGGRAGQVVDLVHLQQYGLHHVVSDDLEVRLAYQVLDVVLGAREEVVQTYHLRFPGPGRGKHTNINRKMRAAGSGEVLRWDAVSERPGGREEGGTSGSGASRARSGPPNRYSRRRPLGEVVRPGVHLRRLLFGRDSRTGGSPRSPHLPSQGSSSFAATPAGASPSPASSLPLSYPCLPLEPLVGLLTRSSRNSLAPRCDAIDRAGWARGNKREKPKREKNGVSRT